MKIATSCDMGSIKIYNNGMSCFFGNRMGDGGNLVEIREDDCDTSDDDFIGHFTCKDGKCHLSSYDCSDDGVFCFPAGRWFVYLKKELDENYGPHFVIVKKDMAIHA